MPILSALTLALATSTASAQSPMPVYIADSPAAHEQVERAEGLRQQGRLGQAAQMLQQVIDEYPARLMRTGPGLYTDAVLWVRNKLLVDDELLAAYRRRFEPTAQRALDLALSPHADREALEKVLGGFALTRSGLDAALALGSFYLERGDVSSASSVLGELHRHPDLDASVQQFHNLAAVAALLGVDDRRLAYHLEQLSAHGFEEAVASIQGLSNRVHPPLRLARLAEPGLVDVGPVPAFDAAPLWEEPIASGATELTTTVVLPPGVRGQCVIDHLATYPVIPTGSGDRLYLNAATTVQARQRHSGRLLWLFDFAAGGRWSELAARARVGRVVSDRRGVLVMGDLLYAVVGRAVIWPGRMARKPPGTAIVCLDRRTGDVQWHLQPGDLDATLVNAYFQGTPLPGYDRLFVLLRRNQISGFQDAFVAAVDAATGRLIWRRHLSSAVTRNRYATASPPQMISHRGRLYVSDNLGTVAAIDGRSGIVRWARVLLDATVPLATPTGRGAAVDVSGPVLVEAGLVVPASNLTGQALLLDPDTGRKLRELTDTVWTSAAYLLPADGDVVAVGPVVGLYDGMSLEAKWTYRLGPHGGSGPHGRAAVTRQFVVLPMWDRMVLVNRGDGSVLGQVELPDPGNIVALEGQLILTSPQGVRSYMPWDQAYETLKGQVRQDPSDPDAALALAYLAWRADPQRVDEAVRQQVVLEGADHAVEALRRFSMVADRTAAEQAQKVVFEQLLEIAESDRPADVALRRALFDRLATVTTNPAQEVAYHLSRGRLLEQSGDVPDAVDHYQAVLLDPSLSSRLYKLHREREVYRQAGQEAQRRLGRLVAALGPEVYARFDAIAAQRLSELTQADVAGPGPLIDLAQQYPLSGAAPQALFEAGRILADAGDARGAVRQLYRAYQRARDRTLLARIVGRVGELYEDTDRPHQALGWLERVKREHDTLNPIRRGMPVSIEQWLAELALVRVAQDAIPALTLPLGAPFLLDGTLLRPPADQPGERPLDRLLTGAGDVVRLHTGATLAVHWEAPLPADDTQVLVHTQEQVLLWSEQAGKLMVLDGATGLPAWPALDVRALLEELGDVKQRDAARPAEQRAFLRSMGGGPNLVRALRGLDGQGGRQHRFLHAVSESVICLADQLGRAVGVDRHTGEMLWRKICPVERLSLMAAGSDAVALAGINGPETAAPSGAVLVLDLVTGEPLLPLIEDRQPPQWVGFAEGGLLLVATAGQISARRLADGQVAWRMALPAFGAGRVGPGPKDSALLMIPCHPHGLVSIDSRSGQILNRLTVGMGSEQGPFQTLAVKGQWQVLTPDAAIALDGQGQIVWCDAISSVPKRLLVQLVGEQYVALLGESGAPAVGAAERAPPLQLPALAGAQRARAVEDRRRGRVRIAPAANPHYRLYVLDRASGLLVAEHILEPLSVPFDPGVGLFLDNRLVLSAGALALVIPGAKVEGDR